MPLNYSAWLTAEAEWGHHSDIIERVSTSYGCLYLSAGSRPGRNAPAGEGCNLKNIRWSSVVYLLGKGIGYGKKIEEK